MHTMFTIRKTSNANTQAQAEAIASIAAKMSSNCTNTLEGSNVIQNSNLPSLAASIANNPISAWYDIGKQGGSAGKLIAVFVHFKAFCLSLHKK